jgi:hypothetical protein
VRAIVRDYLDPVFLFWTWPEKWPKVADYVFLAKAVLAFGQAMFGTKWTDLDPVIEPLDPNLLRRSDQAALDLVAEWRRRRFALEKMMGPEGTAIALTAAARAGSRSHFIRVQQKIAELAVTGVLKTSVRPVPGGELTEVPAHWWRTENEYLAARFALCRLYPTKPFSKTIEINDRYDFYIFVAERDLKKELAALSRSVANTRTEGQPSSLASPQISHRGRRPGSGNYDWPAFEEEAIRVLEHKGDINRSIDPSWIQARLEEQMMNWAKRNWGKEPAPSTIGIYVNRAIAEFRRRKAD